MVETEILLADECWIALALLHQTYGDRTSFSAREIVDYLKQEGAYPEVRAGVQAHIYQHNVANVEPSSARYRMFYKLADGTYRLFRPGDDFHPNRKGKTKPERSGLPARYHCLLDWYEKDYCSRAGQVDEKADPVLRMSGVGKELWAALGGGDAFVAREREGWDFPTEKLADRVWNRILAHQGEEFQTTKGKPFTYRVEGNTGIWFYRNGQLINQRLYRGELEEAIARCPLKNTTVIRDLRDPSYLFGLLMDRRIHDNEW